MDGPLERALSAAFPDRAVAGVETPDSAHPGNRTVRVTVEDGAEYGDRAYPNVRTDGDRERNVPEAAVTRLCTRPL